MKTRNILVLFLALLVGFTAFGHASAQVSNTPSQYATYKVVKSDNMWRIIQDKCGADQAFNWRHYLAIPQNSSLGAPLPNGKSRSFKVQGTGADGWYIFANETITLPVDKCHLPAANLVPTFPANGMMQAAQVPSGVTLAEVSSLFDKKFAQLNTGGEHTPWWMWALLVAMLIVAVMALMRNHGYWRQQEAAVEARAREDAERARANDAVRDALHSRRRQTEMLEEQLHLANQREAFAAAEVAAERAKNFARLSSDGGHDRPYDNGHGHASHASQTPLVGANCNNVNINLIMGNDNTTSGSMSNELEESFYPDPITV